MIYVRVKGAGAIAGDPFRVSDQSILIVNAQDCPACGVPFKVDERAVFVVLGPGANPEAREKAATGRWYNAIATVLHELCATGTEKP